MEKMSIFDGDNLNSKTVRIFNPLNLEEITVKTSSKGNQIKWYDNANRLFIKESFFYLEQYWKVYLVEIIACRVASQLKLNGIKVLNQELCCVQKKTSLSPSGLFQ